MAQPVQPVIGQGETSHEKSTRLESELRDLAQEFSQFKDKLKGRAQSERVIITPHSHDVKEAVKDMTHHKKTGKERSKDPKTPGSSMLPSSQTVPRSYLGNAFKQLARNAKGKKNYTPGYSSSDESSSSSSDTGGDSPDDSEGSSSTSDSSESGSSGTEESSTSKKCRKGKRKSRKAASKLLIKPVPPAMYDGVFDFNDKTKSVLKFNKFLTESLTYVKMGNVQSKDQVLIISQYLSNCTYGFYSRKVSIQRRAWDLKKFFLKLYDHCFPPNFHQLQCDKLRTCCQGKCTVGDFMAELNELFMLIGSILKTEQAVKYCEGLNPEIYAQLMLENLHAETTSLKRLHRRAQVVEVIMQVAAGDVGMVRGQGRSSSGQNIASGPPNDASGCRNSSRNQRRGQFDQNKPRNRDSNRNNGFLQQRQNRRFRKYQSRGTPNGGYRQGRDYDQPNFKSKRSKLSDEETKKLQSENKCFTCHEVGVQAMPQTTLREVKGK
ncbi:hypothetical protein HGRIS_003656 [Hohenbuehelia grisea]|uniref:Gag protein n=1 Tax=Hohenbuehelia grisea TaxID=104357 RepID=A0ABR3JH31_9AGAR